LVGPEFYPGQGNEEILEIADRFPGRFIPFCNIHPRAIDNSPTAPLSDVMKKYKDKGCKGIGEVTVNMPFNDPYMLNFFKHVEIAGLPLTFHIAHCIDNVYGIYDEPGLPLLEETLQKFPGIKFFGHSQSFWAEIGTLREVNDRAGYPDYPIDAEGSVPKLMRKYPNLHGDISAGSGYYAITRDMDFGLKFLEEFQDRLYFGTDIANVPQDLPQIPFFKKLKAEKLISKEAYEKITWKNAVKLFDLKLN